MGRKASDTGQQCKHGRRQSADPSFGLLLLQGINNLLFPLAFVEIDFLVK